MDNSELRGLLAKATPGKWMLATSCSWRRILTADHKPVIVPSVQRSDGHPDLDCGTDYVNAELAIAAVNELPRLLADSDALAKLRAEIAAAPVGFVVEVGNDDEGQPRVLIHSTRDELRKEPPLAFRRVALLRLPAGEGE